MSREERRQYERMMRGMERGPALPQAARARAARNAARRATRLEGRQPQAAFGIRFWVVSLLVAAAAGYLAFSLLFREPIAPMVGVAVFALVLVAQVALRLLTRRRAPTPRG